MRVNLVEMYPGNYNFGIGFTSDPPPAIFIYFHRWYLVFSKNRKVR